MAVPVMSPAKARGWADYVGECVPFARQMSGIQIYGDAWTWWDAAENRYERGHSPRIGSVIVFRQAPHLRLGHVAVVSRIIEPRVLMVTHANWSRFDGKRGRPERDVTLFDVSKRGDWSEVRVWYRDSRGLGSSRYPIAGFIHGRTVQRGLAAARPSPELTAEAPDVVGSLIDAYAR
ncbi:CHAP domain-containing protein [Sphingomonas sp. CJ99]